MKRSSAFTLIELLVVISIIAILASLAIPAVTGALARGQMAQTLSNFKQLHLATFNMDLDNQQAGSGSGWPGTNTGAPSTAIAWAAALTNGNYLKPSEIAKMLSAQSVQADPALTSTNSWAAIVYGVGNVDDGGVVFLSTKNVAFSSGQTNATIPLSTATPYGNKGFVIFHKGGDGQILQARFATNGNTTTNQPAPL